VEGDGIRDGMRGWRIYGGIQEREVEADDFTVHPFNTY
jgi:hypothetical protein